jgi:putative addiction module killer protein
LDSFRDDLSYFLPLLVGFDLVEVDHGGRLSAMGGMGPLVVARVITLVVRPAEDNYSCHMIELIRSATFDSWLSSLRDRRAVTRIAARLDRLAAGNPGDAEPIGEGVSELRISYGPGYRVYFLQRGPVLVILLCGGDKSTQSKDIRQAKVLAEQWKG